MHVPVSRNEVCVCASTPTPRRIPCFKHWNESDEPEAPGGFVGEVLAFGCRFGEAIQKALRMANPSCQGVDGNPAIFLDPRSQFQTEVCSVAFVWGGVRPPLWSDVAGGGCISLFPRFFFKFSNISNKFCTFLSFFLQIFSIFFQRISVSFAFRHVSAFFSPNLRGFFLHFCNILHFFLKFANFFSN